MESGELLRLVGVFVNNVRLRDLTGSRVQLHCWVCEYDRWPALLSWERKSVHLVVDENRTHWERLVNWSKRLFFSLVSIGESSRDNRYHWSFLRDWTSRLFGNWKGCWRETNSKKFVYSLALKLELLVPLLVLGHNSSLNAVFVVFNLLFEDE